MATRGLEPLTLRLLAVRSNQLSYETIWWQCARKPILDVSVYRRAPIPKALPTPQIRCSIVVSISACHAEDPGSIPGGGALAVFFSHPLATSAQTLPRVARTTQNRCKLLLDCVFCLWGVFLETRGRAGIDSRSRHFGRVAKASAC